MKNFNQVKNNISNYLNAYPNRLGDILRLQRWGYFIATMYFMDIKVLRPVPLKRMAPLDYGLSIEMFIRSYRLQIKRAEFPVFENHRTFH
jgi:hypothetical protein